MPSDKRVGLLCLSIGETSNGYVLKDYNVSTVFTTNATPYLTVTYNSTRSFTIKNTNTTSDALGISIF